MAQQFLDFSGVVDVSEALEHEVWSPSTEQPLEVISTPDSSTPAVGFDSGGTGRQFALLKNAITSNVIEYYARIFTGGVTNSENDIYMAGSPDGSGSYNAYKFDITTNSTDIRIRKFISGSLATIVSGSWLHDTDADYFKVRAFWNGTTGDLKLKTWNDADPEPSGWQLETVNTDITTEGNVGLFSFSSSVFYADVFGIGTDGDPAPTEPVSGGGATVDPGASDTTSESTDPSISTGAVVSANESNTSSESPNPAVGSGALVSTPIAQTAANSTDPEISTGASVTTDASDSASESANPTVATGAAVSATGSDTTTDSADPSIETVGGAEVSVSASNTTSESTDPAVSAGAAVSPSAGQTSAAANDPTVSVAASVQPSPSETTSESQDPGILAGASVSPPLAVTEVSAPDPNIAEGATVEVSASATSVAANDPAIVAGIEEFKRTVTITGNCTKRVIIQGKYSRRVTL